MMMPGNNREIEGHAGEAWRVWSSSGAGAGVSKLQTPTSNIILLSAM